MEFLKDLNQNIPKKEAPDINNSDDEFSKENYFDITGDLIIYPIKEPD